MQTPSISVIIICRNEEEQLRELLAELLRVSDVELIVSDGGSSDNTQQVVESHGCRYIRSGRGRGRQLNEGARAACAETLLFLHADCRLESGWKDAIETALQDPVLVGGAFTLKMHGGRPWLDRCLSRTGSWNARRSQIFLGDHSIFVRRRVFQRIGGFPELPLMEDYYFSLKLQKEGKVVQLPSASTASSRRFVRNGYLKTILQMRLLRLCARLGCSSRLLERWYLQI